MCSDGRAQTRPLGLRAVAARLARAGLVLLVLGGILGPAVTAAAAPMCARFAVDGANRLLLLDDDYVILRYAPQYKPHGGLTVLLWQATALDERTGKRRDLPVDATYYSVGNLTAANFKAIAPQNTRYGAAALALGGQVTVWQGDERCPITKPPPTPTRTPTRTPTITPTPTRTQTPTPPRLALIECQLGPDPRPTVFQASYVTLRVRNEGGARFVPPPGGGRYTLRLVLRQVDGRILEERIYAPTTAASWVALDALDGGASQFVKVSDVFFLHSVAGGRLEVTFEPDAALGQVPSSLEIAPIDVQGSSVAAWNCAAQEADALLSAAQTAAPGGQTALAAPAVLATWVGCGTSLACAGSAAGQYLLAAVGSAPAGLIGALADLARSTPGGASGCRTRLEWCDATVQELVRGHAGVNSASVDAGATILVANRDGQVAGFRDDGAAAQDIPAARAIAQGQARWVLFPADSGRTIRIKAAAQGVTTLSLNLTDRGGNLLHAEYADLEVTSQTVGTLDLGDEPLLLRLDDNADGSIERVVRPGERAAAPVTSARAAPTATRVAPTAQVTPTLLPPEPVAPTRLSPGTALQIVATPWLAGGVVLVALAIAALVVGLRRRRR